MAHRRRGVVTVLGGMLALGALLVGAGPIAAATQVEREGKCSGGSDWRLEVEREDGGFKVDLRIRTEPERSGRVFSVRLRQDGVRFFKANRTTDADGEINIERRRPDTAGTDTLFFRAFGPGQERCQGSVTI